MILEEDRLRKHKKHFHSEITQYDSLQSKLFTLNEMFDHRSNLKNNPYQDEDQINPLKFRSNAKTTYKIRNSIEERSDSQQIQVHLLKENDNLKQHNSFLAQEIKKYKHKLKKSSEKLSLYEEYISQLSKENQLYRLEYLNLQEYILSQSHEYHQPYPKQITPQLKQSDSQHSLIQGLTNNIQEHSYNQHLTDLNDQFEAAMYEYKQTKNLETRKLCLQLTKQIKRTKENQKNSLKLKPTNGENLILTQNKRELQPTPTFKPNMIDRKSSYYETYQNQNKGHNRVISGSYNKQ